MRWCGRRHKSGTFTVWRITAKKRMVAKLKAIKAELQRRMFDHMAEVGARPRKVVLGYYQTIGWMRRRDGLAGSDPQLRCPVKHCSGERRRI